MGDKLSKNKMLIIVGTVLIIAIVVLVVIIVKINKDDTDETGSVSDNITTTVENSKNNISTTDQINNSENSDVKTNDNSQEKANENNTITELPVSESNEIIVSLGEYKGLKVGYSPVVITDEDIDYNLKQLQSEYTEIVDMPDRPFENGDMAIVSYKGRVDGEIINQLDVVCLQVVLGRGMLPDVMEEKIIGSKKGNSFEVSIDYPSDYTGIDGIAGKTVVYTVELVDGFTFEVPELTDSFISSVTEYGSIDSYKKSEKERLQKEQDEIAYEAAVEELKRKVVDNCSFEGDIDNEIKRNYVLRLQEESDEIMDSYWMDVDSYYQLMYGYEPGEYTQKLMDSITYDTKYSYILDEIIKKENISVSDAEYEEYLSETYTPEHGYTNIEDVYIALGENKVKSEVNTTVARYKAAKLIFDSADITDSDE